MAECRTNSPTNFCKSYPDARCVVYTGVRLPCINVNTNDRLEEILTKIDEKVCSSIGTGTVTSVAASITSGAISIAGSPITTSGTLAFTYTGTSSQYIAGDGSLVTFPSIPVITNEWHITGNSGTTAGTNFWGTTDDVDVVGKRNGTELLRIGSAGIGITNSTPTSKLHIKTDNILAQSDAYGIFLENSTATTTNPANRVQMSPPVIWQGHAWRDNFFGTGVDQIQKWKVDVLPQPRTLQDTYSFWKLYNSTNGGAYRELLSVSSITGALSIYDGTGTTYGQFSTINSVGIGFNNATLYVGTKPLNFGAATAFQNTTFGRDAMYNMTTGSYTCGFGEGALYTSTTANFNSAFGYLSMFYTTTGEQNSAFGGNSLLFNTTGFKNSAFGAGAGENNTIGQENVFLGQDSGLNNTIGVYNVYVGVNAKGGAGGVGNIILGYYAGASLASPVLGDTTDNIFLGRNTGFNASQKTDAKNTIAIGTGAFTTADNQMVLGNTSITETFIRGAKTTAPDYLYGELTDGSLTKRTLAEIASDIGAVISLSAIGSSPNANAATITGTVLNLQPASASFGGVVTTGTQTFAGVKSFSSDITVGGTLTTVGNGGNSTSVRMGRESSGGTTMRANSVAIGYQSLYNNSSGFGGNTAVGWVAGYAITSGYNNLAFGDGAGYGITSGHDNTAIGVGAMGTGFIGVGTSGITGNYNVALGYNTLFYEKGSSANIAIGYNALSGSSLASVNGANIAIGAGAGSGITTGSYNLILGGNSGSSIATSSNYILIADGQGNERMRFNNSGALSFDAGANYGVANYVLISNGNAAAPSWVDISSLVSTDITVGTTVINSGTDTRVPFNDSGVYGEDAGFTYNKTTDTLTVAANIISPTHTGSTAADGTLTLVGNNAGAGNTSSNKNIIMNVGNTPTQAMALYNSGVVHIGSPTYNAAVGFNVQNIGNSKRDGVRFYANNLTTYVSFGYGGISSPAILDVEGNGGIQLLGASSAVYMNMLSSGKFFFGGSTSPTATVHLAAGTASANTAPLKFTTGTSLTTPEAGAFEYTTPQLFFTNGGAIRQEIPQIQQARVSTQYDNTTTTLGTVTGLTTNVAAGKTYRFEAILYTTSDASGGVKFAMAGTATATNIIYEAVVLNGASVSAQTRATTLATTVGAVTGVTNAYCKITGTIIVNAAGTLLVQAAANAAVGTTSVLVGSTFVITEML